MGYTTGLKALDSNGRVQIGMQNATVDYSNKNQNQGTSNDSAKVMARIQFDVTGITKSDYLTIDIRDDYDFQGKINIDEASLEPENQVRLREAAYHRPPRPRRIFFSAGRFPAPYSGIIATDGARIGYSSSKNLRLGALAGAVPSELANPVYVTPDTSREQETNVTSAFIIYERPKSAKGRITGLYTSNALTTAPTSHLVDSSSRTFYYHSGLLHLGLRHQIRTLLHFDLDPENRTRYYKTSYTYFSKNFRASLATDGVDNSDYYLRKDSSTDSLEPSGVINYYLTLRQALGRKYFLNAKVLQGSRVEDNLVRSDYSVSMGMRMLRGRFIGIATYGTKEEFIRKGPYTKLSLRYYANSYNLNISHHQQERKYDSGSEASAQMMAADVGFFINRKLRGIGGVTYIKGEEVSIMNYLVMIGYRFGESSTAPVKNRASLFERL